jgi:hypothetical protein
VVRRVASCGVILSEAKNLSGKGAGREILRRFHPNVRKTGARWGPRLCAPQNDTTLIFRSLPK